MNRRGAMIAVHRMVLQFARGVVVNMDRGGAIRQETIGRRHARKRQRDGRRQDAQQIKQRNNAACSQSLGPGQSQIVFPEGGADAIILAATQIASKPEFLRSWRRLIAVRHLQRHPCARAAPP